MEKINPASSWNLKPTPKQVRSIAKLCSQLGITEPLEERPSNRVEARRLIFALRCKRNDRAYLP